MLMQPFYKYLASCPQPRIFSPDGRWFNAFSQLYGAALTKALAYTQYLPAEKLLKIQNRRLWTLLERAKDTVPFYQRRLKSVNLLQDFFLLEPLTKDVARKEFESGSIINAGLESFGIPFTTSGSTGIPLGFFRDKNMAGWRFATHLRSFMWAGGTKDDLVIHVFPYNFVREMYNRPPFRYAYFECRDPRWVDKNIDLIKEKFTDNSVVLWA